MLGVEGLEVIGAIMEACSLELTLIELAEYSRNIPATFWRGVGCYVQQSCRRCVDSGMRLRCSDDFYLGRLNGLMARYALFWSATVEYTFYQVS